MEWFYSAIIIISFIGGGFAYLEKKRVLKNFFVIVFSVTAIIALVRLFFH